ncbi:hypothetical protein KBP30_28405 [Streptomyces sp. Go40/10]|uniref:DUF6578 domain-containing protein n=1 Tax=Streptomyces sp. Go40/10 TaxID=2825844 RepID=UPI001E28C591|nr:DUF6578 domain-containing protein [Streptomyces sp. Go40/10]UFR04837.1 hypothetical protein KBP30_28405 [Streptomyces sp. Go40/10]
MALMKVFYADWQMECCGRPFGVGKQVAWPLVAVDEEHADGQWYGADAWVENHGDVPHDTTGHVRAIELVYQVYAETGPGSRTFEPVPEEWSLEPVDSCPKWFRREETAGGPGPRRSRDQAGVLVTLEVPTAGARP